MKRRRLTDWHRSRVRAAYGRTGSVRAAAEAAGVSLPSAYRILDGVHQAQVPVYPARLQGRAVEMYLSGLSCRGVAARLAEEMDPAPSQQWVYERVEAAGVLRTRSEADRLMNERLHGKDYDELSRRAVRMVAVERRSVREVARLLGVSRNMVKGAVESVPGPAEATRRRAWESPHAGPRLRRLDRVRRLREQGMTQGAIAEELGESTVFLDLKRMGLTGSRDRPRRA